MAVGNTTMTLSNATHNGYVFKVTDTVTFYYILKQVIVVRDS